MEINYLDLGQMLHTQNTIAVYKYSRQEKCMYQ